MHRRTSIGKFRFFARFFAAGLLLLAVPKSRAATGTIQDVQHVVILMMENRSFDHYCGCMSGVRGFNERNPLLLSSGQSDLYQPEWGTNFLLPFPINTPCINDVDHTQGTGLADWDGGKWDQWVQAKGQETMSYYPSNFLALHYALAGAYTICDNYFCSLIGPTYPNRLYLFTGMIDPNGTGGGPATANSIPPGGFTWTTYPELLQTAGVNWKVYRPNGDWFGDVLPWFAQFMHAAPGNPLYDRGVAEVPNVVTALTSDVTNGTLPQVSWIIPTINQSGHPPYSPVDGEVFIQSVYNALAANPAVLNSTVFLVTYDENGGFYDHIPSPIAPPGTPGEYVNGQPLGLGVRIPTLIISPWSRGGRVCSQVFDHTSIIRFLETWTGVVETNISPWRRQVCGDLTSAFDFTNPVTNNYPALPVVSGFESGPSAPVPPPWQELPLQQTNSRPALPLPYQPEITAQTDCATGKIHLAMTNAGAASVHFAIYASPVQKSGPLQCDVAPGAALVESFPGTSYNLTCYGPNGFQRQYAGRLASDCNLIEAFSSIDTNGGNITVTLENNSAQPVAFVLIDNYGLENPATNNVAPELTASSVIPAGVNNNGWYDLTVTASSDATFLRRYTGHIENGAISMTEPVLTPVIVPPPPAAAPTPPVPVVLTNAPSVTSLLAVIPRQPPLNSLPLYAVGFNTNVALIFPGWASNYTVLASPTLMNPTWIPLSVSLTNLGNYAAAVMSPAASSMFFRLQQPGDDPDDDGD